MLKTLTVLLAIGFSTAPFHAQLTPTPAKETAPMNSQAAAATSHARSHATATITVQNSGADPWDPDAAGPALLAVHIDEVFAGDIAGRSQVRALQVQHADRSATLVSLQRFRGKLNGRAGSFILEGHETVRQGNIQATWFVVPSSGTGELTGLRGEGGFTGEFGKGSRGTLDYWFE